MWCAACSRQTDGGAPYCDQCGAALCASPSQLALLEREEPSSSRSRRIVTASVASVFLVITAGLLWSPPKPSATPDVLQAAMHHAMASGDVPGRDPVCVANGLAYDQEPVNVEADNAATISWMNVLVEAGLYQTAENSMSGGLMPQPLLVYRPLPLLAQWGGARRLCIAKGVKLADVGNVGRVDDMRLRGKRYTGVPADVRWVLDEPAPWLASPAVAEALVRELPSWRSARWQADDDGGWRLTQRKNFVHIGEFWVSGDVADRAPSRAFQSPM